MDSNFNTVPNVGTFGNAVSKINANFQLAKVAIDGIELSTTKNKAIYSSLSALQAAVPTPTVGDWAGVGTSFPIEVYVCNTAGTWVDGGTTWSGGNITLSDYVTSTEFTSLENATNDINVDKLVQISSGYYTLTTAIAALAGKSIIKTGMIITFESDVHVFERWQFIGDIANFSDETLWINTKENGKDA